MKEMYRRGLLVLILFFIWIGPAVPDTSANYWAPGVTDTNTPSATINWRGESNGSGSIDYANSSYYNQHQSFEKTIASQTPLVLDTDDIDYLPLHAGTKPAFYANFTAAPLSGSVPLSVAFTDSSEGDPDFWNYDFGDGITSRAKNPIHLYRAPGTYTVTLTIIKNEGGRLERNTTVKPDLITVNDTPRPVLVANFTAAPLSGSAPLSVAFTDSSEGDPDFWNYDFGDGLTSRAKNPIHLYRTPGTYAVTLTIIKNERGRLERNTTVKPDLIEVSTPAVGWAIGQDQAGTPAIVHTTDGGLTWQVQGDLSAWPDMEGNDISAVDDQTAWAALGSGNMNEARGAILHTTDGGTTWVVQPIPDGLLGGIIGVKGLSRNEAWAASLGGVVMHTLDGGSTWNIVPHPDVYLSEVNRIDATSGGNVWIADTTMSGDKRYIIHSTDNGDTWRQETLQGAPLDGQTFVVSAYSSQVVWSTVRPYTDIYRTVDGGTNWFKVATSLGGNNDFDDICASSAETVWGVLNEMLTGTIYRVHVAENGSVVSQVFSPADTVYSYEGITCLDDRIIWAVGRQSIDIKPELPLGVIVYTVDGGERWVQGIGPPNIKYWKVSFVGARR
jgi:PKD repeat protein